VSPARALFTAVYLLVWPALMLLLAGDWRWPEGWISGAARRAIPPHPLRVV